MCACVCCSVFPVYCIDLGIWSIEATAVLLMSSLGLEDCKDCLRSRFDLVVLVYSDVERGAVVVLNLSRFTYIHSANPRNVQRTCQSHTNKYLTN